MALLLRSFGAVGGKDEPPAAQAFKLTHLSSEVFLDASIWPGHGLHVGTAEDAQEKQEKRRLIACSERSSRYMCSMCSEERNVECPGGLWRPGIGVLAHLASV